MPRRGMPFRRKAQKQGGAVVRVSRKERRKEERKRKKEEKNLYFTRKKLSKTGANPKEGAATRPKADRPQPPTGVREGGQGKAGDKCLEELKRDAEKRRREAVRRQEERRLKEGRKRQLEEANISEERNIKRLEKQLKLNTKKRKSLPASFKASGLDYILDVCDADKLKEAVEAERTLYDSEFEKDFALMTGKELGGGEAKEPVRGDKKKRVLVEEEEGTTSGEEGESGEEEDHDGFDEEGESDVEHDDSGLEQLDEDSSDRGEQDSFEEELDSNIESEESDPGEPGSEQEEEDGPEKKRAKRGEDGQTWEDIYGRKRDHEGNVIVEKMEAWRPGRLREVGKTGEGAAILSKQLKGLLNRLSEPNIRSIASQVEKIYMGQSRHETNECLTSLLLASIVTEDPAPESLVLQHALLVAVLHANVGLEIGAFILERVVARLVTLMDEGSRGKELENCCAFLAHLYNFKVFECGLMYEVLNRLMGEGKEEVELGERALEAILVVLGRAGFALRRDDPRRIAAFLHRVHLASNQNTQHNSRFKFMVEVLVLIKNNQREKLARLYDSEPTDRLAALLKTLLRKGNFVSTLNISLQDLLRAGERGKWWVVGSAWRGDEEKGGVGSGAEREGASASQDPPSQEILALASQHRMNTTHRRNIFSIILTAQDYLEAFERLVRLGLKGETERDIVHVLMHCLQHEREYNPYYAHLAALLCQGNRRHLMAIKCGIWERVREVDSRPDSHVSNLAKFLAFLILEKALPLTVLKVMEFGELGKGGVRLVRQTMLSILVGDHRRTDEEIVAVFGRIPSSSAKLAPFRQSLALFIHHFITKQTNASSSPDPLLVRRIQLATQALS